MAYIAPADPLPWLGYDDNGDLIGGPPPWQLINSPAEFIAYVERDAAPSAGELDLVEKLKANPDHYDVRNGAVREKTTFLERYWPVLAVVGVTAAAAVFGGAGGSVIVGDAYSGFYTINSAGVVTGLAGSTVPLVGTAAAIGTAGTGGATTAATVAKTVSTVTTAAKTAAAVTAVLRGGATPSPSSASPPSPPLSLGGFTLTSTEWFVVTLVAGVFLLRRSH